MIINSKSHFIKKCMLSNSSVWRHTLTKKQSCRKRSLGLDGVSCRAQSDLKFLCWTWSYLIPFIKVNIKYLAGFFFIFSDLKWMDDLLMQHHHTTTEPGSQCVSLMGCWWWRAFHKGKTVDVRDPGHKRKSSLPFYKYLFILWLRWNKDSIRRCV